MGIVEQTMERFLADCAKNYTEQSLKRFRSDLNVASAFESSSGCPLNLAEEEELKRLLISYHCFSIQSFRDKKFLLLRYLRWLEKQGTDCGRVTQLLSEIDYDQISSGNDFGKYYFGTFEQLVLFLEAHIGRAAEEGGKDRKEFLTAAVLCTLAWHGLTAEEACSLRKTEVLRRDGAVVLQLADREVILEEKAAEWVLEFLRAGGFERFKGGGWELVTYREGNFFLRTTKADFMTPKSVANMLTRLNAMIPDADKVFLYARIYSSGRFYRAWQEEMKMGSTLEQRAGTSVPVKERRAYGKLLGMSDMAPGSYKLLREIRLYQEFKRYFYSNPNS